MTADARTALPDPASTTVAAAFADAGVEGFLHAVDLVTGAEVGHRPDAPVVAASTFKVAVLVELCRQADVGEIDLTEPVAVPAEGRAGGPTGLSAMRDAVTLSWRDLALSMIVVSDNAATDVIADRVGLDRVEASMRQLGLSGTRLPVDCRGIYEQLRVDAGVERSEDFPFPTPIELLPRLRALDPAATTATTPRDMTTLLARIWDDTAASPASCELIRAILAAQVWPHRLASGFPEDDVATAGKTGTLPSRRNEVGVVSYPDGGRYAVAVFVVEPDARLKNPASDAAIGAAARVAVDLLREAGAAP